MYWQRVAARVSAETPINKHGAREISEPTLNPCVTRAGFRHLRTRHRLTTQLRAVKSRPRFPAATEIPEVRYCAQGFNVGPRYFPGVVRVQRLRQSAFVLRLGYIDPAESFAFPLPACTSPTLNRPGADLGFPLVMVIVQACPRRSRQPAIWHQVTSPISLGVPVQCWSSSNSEVPGGFHSSQSNF